MEGKAVWDRSGYLCGFGFGDIIIKDGCMNRKDN